MIHKSRILIRYIVLTVLTVCTFVWTPLQGQEKPGLVKKLMDKFLSSEYKNDRSPSIIGIPTLGYSQESGFEYGLGGVYSFYLNKDNLVNKSSNITANATMTTKKQKNMKVEADIWTNDNDYHFISELRWRDWPFNFYGLGMNTLEADNERIGQKMISLKLEGERKIMDKVYAGLSLKYENLTYQPTDSSFLFENADMNGKSGGQHFAFGPIFSFDSRNTNTYTTEGFYFRTMLNFSPKLWSDDDFHGRRLEADLRYFYPITKKIALGSQVLYRNTEGKLPPYYALNPLGGSKTMRGYYEGRYVDKNYLTGQLEVRYRPLARFGLVAFSGVGSTFSKNRSERWIGSVGGGLRYFYSLEHQGTLRLDYAVGEQRPGEKRQTGFYLSISEAF